MSLAKGPEIVYRAAPREFAKGQLAELEDAPLVGRVLAGEDRSKRLLCATRCAQASAARPPQASSKRSSTSRRVPR